jgi:hypothetical protein
LEKLKRENESVDERIVASIYNVGKGKKWQKGAQNEQKRQTKHAMFF